MCDSDDDELKFGCLGTPFNIENDETIENKRVKLKKKAAEEEVTDEKGRALRFHGAFTGGFSAGYYNTVGSKEGFKPQQFSSKVGEKRNFRSIANPEDFMDEEDFSEHGIAPKMLQMSKNYDDAVVRSQFKDMLGANSIFGNEEILKGMLIPERLTIGVRLLKKLGYCSSKGVGEVREKSDSENSSIDLSDNDEDKDKQFYISKRYYTSHDDAIGTIKDKSTTKPKKKEICTKNQAVRFEYDSESVFKLTSKLDKFGIGYSGMDRDYFNRHKNYDTANYRGNNRGRGVNFGYQHKRGIQGVAFEGVDYDGEDDGGYIDPYAKDSLSNYNFEISDDQEDDRKRPGKYNRGNRHSAIQSNTFGWTAPKFSQGAITQSGSITGFHLSTSASNKTKSINSVHFESLRIPKFFIPICPLIKDDTKSDSSATTKQMSYYGKKHDAYNRVKLMPSHDEKEKKDKSAFDLMSRDDKQRLNNMVSSINSGWQDNKSNLNTSSRWDFKPLSTKSSSIASIISGASCQFKSAGKSTESQDIDYNIERSSDHTLDTQESSDMKQRQEAARSGQYGFMTRKTFDWFPDAMLCRRFNVPNPYPGSTITGILDSVPTEYPSKEKKDTEDQLAIENGGNEIEESFNEIEKDPFLNDEGKYDDEDDIVETKILDITTDQPSIDLFKSVFDVSDYDYDDDDYNVIDKDMVSNQLDSNPSDIYQQSTSIVNQLEEALGMTMGDKLDDIRGLKPMDCSSQDNEITMKKYTFGPALPPNYSLEKVESNEAPSNVVNHIISRDLPNRNTEIQSSDSDAIVYQDPSKLSRKKSKKTKKKSKSSKKRKTNKSSKKKKRQRSSSDSSSDS